MGFWGWVILFIAIGGIVQAIKESGEPEKSKGRTPRANGKKKQRAIEGTHWPESGGCDFNVVGESYYQPALAKIAGDHGEKGCRKMCVATMVLEDDNPYDNKAVRVDVDGMTVGHLSREDARSYRRRLGSMGLTGETMTCAARIGGGRLLDDGQRTRYGIWLDIKPFW